MGMNIRLAASGLLAAAVMACLGVFASAIPATASPMTAPRIHSFSSRTGSADTKVTITGSSFTKVTKVRFNGVAVAFKVRSSSKITAVVSAIPSAAGPITVTTRAGTARSRTRFTVIPRIALTPATGPPTSVVTVSGTGFGATEGVDVFVGTTDEALAGTSTAGSFGPITITIPANAVPGSAWISAGGRHSRLFAQHPFTVNTNWAQYRDSDAHTGTNPFENVLSRSNVARLDQDWNRNTENDVLSSPAVANGVVYIGSSDGKLYAFGLPGGFATPARPSRDSLHPDYSLRQQR